MQQAANDGNEHARRAVSRMPIEFTHCGVPLVIPVGAGQHECLIACGEMLSQALAVLEPVAMGDVSQPADLNQVWAAFRLIEIARKFNQAAEAAR